MSQYTDPDLFDVLEADDADFLDDDGLFDDYDDSGDLSTLRTAWMGSNDRFE
jgi:hypothetical protein